MVTVNSLTQPASMCREVRIVLVRLLLSMQAAMWSLDSDLVAAIHLFFQQVFAQPLVGQSDRNDVY